MDFENEKRLKYDIYLMVLVGSIIALLAFGYGVYCLVNAQCTVVGRGNPPIGTFLTLYGTDARLVSTIYIGTGIFLFARFLVRNIPKVQLSRQLSWVGALTILFGLCSLVIIMLSPLFT